MLTPSIGATVSSDVIFTGRARLFGVSKALERGHQFLTS